MSNDPFANTTTVKNILNHIISPKIVKDGSGGYTTKTDLVNIDNLIFASPASTAGTEAAPLTAQCGIVTITGIDRVTLYHSRVTENSIIVAGVKRLDNAQRNITHITSVEGSFTIILNGSATGINGSRVSWFIASF